MSVKFEEHGKVVQDIAQTYEKAKGRQSDDPTIREKKTNRLTVKGEIESEIELCVGRLSQTHQHTVPGYLLFQLRL